MATMISPQKSHRQPNPRSGNGGASATEGRLPGSSRRGRAGSSVMLCKTKARNPLSNQSPLGTQLELSAQDLIAHQNCPAFLSKSPGCVARRRRRARSIARRAAIEGRQRKSPSGFDSEKDVPIALRGCGRPLSPTLARCGGRSGRVSVVRSVRDRMTPRRCGRQRRQGRECRLPAWPFRRSVAAT